MIEYLIAAIGIVTIYALIVSTTALAYQSNIKSYLHCIKMQTIELQRLRRLRVQDQTRYNRLFARNVVLGEQAASFNSQYDQHPADYAEALMIDGKRLVQSVREGDSMTGEDIANMFQKAPDASSYKGDIK